MAQPPLLLKLGTQVAPIMWAVYNPSCSRDLIAVGRSMEAIYPGQSAARTAVTTGHQPPATMEDQLAGTHSTEQDLAGLWCPLSPPPEYVISGDGWVVVLSCGL